MQKDSTVIKESDVNDTCHLFSLARYQGYFIRPWHNPIREYIIILILEQGMLKLREVSDVQSK
jgi:hypothetical protein